MELSLEDVAMLLGEKDLEIYQLRRKLAAYQQEEAQQASEYVQPGDEG